MKKKAVKEERKARKLILYSETLRSLNLTELQQAVAATGNPCGTTACTGSADCCDHH